MLHIRAYKPLKSDKCKNKQRQIPIPSSNSQATTLVEYLYNNFTKPTKQTRKRWKYTLQMLMGKNQQHDGKQQQSQLYYSYKTQSQFKFIMQMLMPPMRIFMNNEC